MKTEQLQKKEIAESAAKKYINAVGISAFFQERNHSTDKNKQVQKLSVSTFQLRAWCLQEQRF